MPDSRLNLAQRAAAIRSELTRLQAQLELIEELMIAEGIIPTSRVNGSVDPRQRDLDMRPDMTLKEAFREGVLHQNRPFTKKDIIAWIHRSYPTLPFNPKSIETPFYMLVQEGLIETHRKKYGQTAAIYRRTDQRPP